MKNVLEDAGDLEADSAGFANISFFKVSIKRHGNMIS